MYPICKDKRCSGARHDPRLNCTVARRLAEVAARQAAPAVETLTSALVETSKPAPVVETRHGRHRDPDAHRERMREHMRRKRGQAKPISA